MKKILFMIPLLALLFTACDPTSEDNGPGANISAEELTNDFSISQESEGNNNLTFDLAHARYVKIYNADTGGLVAQGTNSLKAQVVPPTTTANFYAEAINPDGSKVKSTTKSVTVSNYTNLPKIFDDVFGKDANGNYQTSTWTWDDTLDGNGYCWGNGGWGNDSGPSWWGFPVGDNLEGQASSKGLAGDGLSSAWFSLSLSEGVKTSRGETGTVVVDENPAQQGWDRGTMTFSGTVPLLGVLPNDGNQKCYKYQILKAGNGKLVLVAHSIAGDYEGWFMAYKQIPNK